MRFVNASASSGTLVKKLRGDGGGIDDDLAFPELQ